MKNGPPALIAIDHDDYHASQVGRTADGRQFFATTPFGPVRMGQPNQGFVAVYLFDMQGKLLEAHVDHLGEKAALENEDGHWWQFLEQRVGELGPVEYGRVEVQPFQIERFGIPFGLIPRRYPGDQGRWWVELQPGNYMAFHEPWDSGEYDT